MYKYHALLIHKHHYVIFNALNFPLPSALLWDCALTLICPV